MYSSDKHIRTMALTDERYRQLHRAQDLTGLSGARLIDLALESYLTRVIARKRARNDVPSPS